MAYLESKLKPYNPKAYVPGGSSAKKAKAIVAKGKLAPVPTKKNPYVRPQAGGGSGAVTTTSPFNRIGADAQMIRMANRAPVSTSLDINYESDPVLARIRALNQSDLGNVETQANSEKKKAIIDTGLADIGQEIGLDAGTLQAARENPFSTLQRIQRESMERGRALDEELNQGNLFYSGYRANQLGDLARSTSEEQANLSRDLRLALGGIDSTVMGAKGLAAEREQEAIEEAARVAREAALQKSYDDALAAALNPPLPQMAPQPQGTVIDPSDPYVQQLMQQSLEENPLSAGLGPSPYVDYSSTWLNPAPAYSPVAPGPTQPDFSNYQYTPEPVWFPPTLTPEEELMLALGAGAQGFANYAI